MFTKKRTIKATRLRKDAAGVLRQVQRGQEFEITKAGRVIAELLPLSQRSHWVPRYVVERIIREAPLDPEFRPDVDSLFDERIDEI